MAPPLKQKFIEGEKVLCYHGPLIYEAKCLKSSVTKDKLIKYFVHYAGWSKNWDEWVPEARVLKYNDVNVAKQKEVLKNHSTPAKTKKSKAKAKAELNSTKEPESRANTPVSDTQVERKGVKTKVSLSANVSETSTSTPELAKKKRGKFETQAEEESDSQFKIKLPEELKAILADDWAMVSKQKKLWTLPASMTVDDILEQYVNHKKQAKPTSGINKESMYADVTKGIRGYFNAMLSSQLLYNFERQQFEEEQNEDDTIEASAKYGGIHLLRMFVRLGANLGLYSLDGQSLQFLMEQFEDFLKHLMKTNGNWFNVHEIFSPTPDYLKKAGMY